MNEVNERRKETELDIKWKLNLAYEELIHTERDIVT